MALSDVTVNVNITSAAGSEGTWFPLILAAGSAVDAACSYKECYNLNQIVDVTAGYTDSDTRAERVTKTEKAKNTYLYGAADKICQQNQPPNRIAIISIGNKTTFSDMEAALSPYLDKGWRQLVLVGIVEPEAKLQLAEYIESLEQRKLLFLHSNSSETMTATITMADEKQKKLTLTDYTRTVAVYHPQASTNYVNAAVVGAVAGKIAGSINYRNMVINGIAPVALTAKELDTLHKNGYFTVVERSGDTVTSTGKSASNKRYLDTLDTEDYVVQQLTIVTQKALNDNDIVRFNDDGISILENAAVSVMTDCCSKGMIAKKAANTYQYTVDYPSVSQVDAKDLANRAYKIGTVTFTAQGAVDTVDISVNMEL